MRNENRPVRCLRSLARMPPIVDVVSHRDVGRKIRIADRHPVSVPAFRLPRSNVLAADYLCQRVIPNTHANIESGYLVAERNARSIGEIQSDA